MKIRSADAQRAEQSVQQWRAAWLASLGPTHIQRGPRIGWIFETRNSVAYAQHMWKFNGVGGAGNYIVEQGYCIFSVSRSIASMDNREREHLRILDLLISAANGADLGLWSARASLLWANGKANVEHIQVGPALTWERRPEQTHDAFLRNNLMSVDQVVSWVQQRLYQYDADPRLIPDFRQIVEDAKSLLNPAGSGAWLRPAELGSTVFAPTGPHSLHIGSFRDGTPLRYSGEGSVVTIAPPGAGKTQCNVFPNLLTWVGPAVVLDVSGDLYEHTAAWRAAQVGPVFRFAPLEPATSHKFNPLTFVRNEPDYIWEDAQLLAELMIVPSSSLDPFWENEARTVVTAAIAYVAYANPPEQRPMHAMLDVLFGGPAWDAMLAGLRMALDVRVMVQHASSLSTMNEKTLTSVLQTARSSLSAWTGERVGRATAHSDWHPLDLRGAQSPTIYICVKPNEVDAYLSLLRVFIGQHIRVLTGGGRPFEGCAADPLHAR